MDTSRITANDTDTNCTGVIQLSDDGFTTCVQMQSLPISNPEGDSFTITPLSPLSYSTTYRLKITTGAVSLAGSPIDAEYVTPSGFSTIDQTIVIFRIDPAVTGGFGATHQADCESAKSSLGIQGLNVKPFISIGLGSEIKDIAGVPQTGVALVSASGVQLKTDWSTLWADDTLDNSLFAAGVLPLATDFWWPGTYGNGQTGSGGAPNCASWADNSSGSIGVFGDASADADRYWIWDSTANCDQSYYRLCVAW